MANHSLAKATIFKHYFVNFFDFIIINRGGCTTYMEQYLDEFTTYTEGLVPLKYLCLC